MAPVAAPARAPPPAVCSPRLLVCGSFASGPTNLSRHTFLHLRREPDDYLAIDHRTGRSRGRKHSARPIVGRIDHLAGKRRRRGRELGRRGLLLLGRLALARRRRWRGLGLTDRRPLCHARGGWRQHLRRATTAGGCRYRRAARHRERLEHLLRLTTGNKERNDRSGSHMKK